MTQEWFFKLLIYTHYNTAKFAHMNGHWKTYDKHRNHFLLTRLIDKIVEFEKFSPFEVLFIVVSMDRD